MNAKAGGGLGLVKVAGLIALAAAAFHLAFAAPQLSPLIAVYFWCLAQLTRIRNRSCAFSAGMILGLLVFVPKVAFFFTIFGAFAAVLWMVLAFWHGLFLYLGTWAQNSFKKPWGLLLLPLFWTGLEYFRSELYPLKFSWMAGGYAFATQPNVLLAALGVYGVGFVVMFAAAGLSMLKPKPRGVAAFLLFCVFAFLAQLPPPRPPEAEKYASIAGMQLEFPVQLEVPAKLDLLKQKHPEAEIFVLSEYTFDGPVPPVIRKWCAKNKKHLVVGGKDPLGTTNYYNTAFVIGPDGEVVFKQVKAVPIQFFKDGLPAPAQQVWDSPWGKIGLLVCYDLSYARVVDELVRQGAQILIAPTMDVADWGRQQHEQHALIAPTRAAEYRIPIFRLASSGISQAVSAQGQVIASAPFPGQEETLFAKLPMRSEPRLPLDRTLGPICSGLALAGFLFSFVPMKWLLLR